MCGIAGIYRFDGKPLSALALQAMTDRMVERGPDDDGFHVDGSVGLGMRRLSIIDVEGGHQPLTNEDRTLTLVLNGEIYNHLELRTELARRGHVFRTGSDAEVVLHLYEDLGVEALTPLNGMFAFALFDARARRLWLARDRLGVKPLYVAQTAEAVAFASDIRALRAVVPSTVESAHVLAYLALGYVPGNGTLWSGIEKLRPGHHMVIEATGRIATTRYWSPESSGVWVGSAQEAKEQLYFLLRDSIRLQLRSDVPLGVYLSGGVDSSSVVAFAAKQVTEPLRTFTISFRGKGGSDSRFARMVSRQYHTSHTELAMGASDSIGAMNDLVTRMDEPIADSAILPAFILAKAAREQGLKVLLNGAGGDEIFGGYRRHLLPPVGSPAWVAECCPAPIRKALIPLWSAFDPGRAVRAKDPRLAWATGISGANLHILRTLLRNPGDYETIEAIMRQEFAGILPHTAASYSHRRMMVDVETYLPNDVLSLLDKATMAASVEGRVPLLDHRLVEFASSLPVTTNLASGQPKGLLKAVMKDYLPAELLFRNKEGFNAPDGIWIAEGLHSSLKSELLDSPCPVIFELIRPDALAVLLGSHGTGAAASTLFAMYVLNHWHRAQRESLQ